MVTHCHLSPQQLCQLNHWPSPFPIVNRLRTTDHSKSNPWGKQSNGRTNGGTIRWEQTISNSSAEPYCQYKGIPELQYRMGQKVWLEAKNLPLQYGSPKLTPRCHGPFQIIKDISPVTYQLDLPHQWNIHPVFHASLLTPFIETDSHGPNFSRLPPDLIKGEAEYEVEDI
jgi:hypothetical protein